MAMTRISRRLFLSGFFLLSLTSLAESGVFPVDSDFDGKLDQWQHKSESGQLLKVEYDKNGDGKIDQIDVFEGHERPLRVELDRNLDGTLDQVQHYSKSFTLEGTSKNRVKSGWMN